MPIYRGVSGVNREIEKQFRGVGGVNREIERQFRGVSGVNRKVFERKKYIFEPGYYLFSNGNSSVSGGVWTGYASNYGTGGIPQTYLIMTPFVTMGKNFTMEVDCEVSMLNNEYNINKSVYVRIGSFRDSSSSQEVVYTYVSGSSFNIAFSRRIITVSVTYDLLHTQIGVQVLCDRGTPVYAGGVCKVYGISINGIPAIIQ